jgi:hypothetical protein
MASDRLFRIGGLVAAAVLIAFGIGSLVAGIVGGSEVRDTIKREKIEGSPDMTPEETRKAVAEAGVDGIEVPSCSVAGEQVDTGTEAKCFADYIRVHTLESTQGRTYSEMGRFLTADGEETSDEAQAAKDPETGEPVPNGARNLWVTSTALSTALNTSFFAESVALFSIVMGIALLLTGIGFLVLVLGLARRRAATEERTAV